MESIEKYGEVMLVGEMPHTGSRQVIISNISAAEQEFSIISDFDTVDLRKRATAKHQWFKPSLRTSSSFVKA